MEEYIYKLRSRTTCISRKERYFSSNISIEQDEAFYPMYSGGKGHDSGEDSENA